MRVPRQGARLYLATMQPFGAAAQARIARHRALRRGKGFETVERPLGLAGLELPQRYDGILLEDLGNLLANELFDPRARARRRSAASLQASRICKTAAKRWSSYRTRCFQTGSAYPPETAAYIRTLGR